ncbi:glucan endo-1,3-beta-glucosidase-like [Diospyros lotus]|uniref:glucan endo-1,3-beta-glucosidase-like n=1 Tax=Diospyros lotus TaxID=55363 RepID=UPI00224DB481|nr:glucan endo-1,3-beta-glucosidase-like [Diospyros lotus]
MAKPPPLPPRPVFFFLISSVLLHHFAAVDSFGVNFGTVANNLPPAEQVAQFIKEKTIIDRVKIFDMNPDIIRAFAGTDILVCITVPNGDIPALANTRFARRWVTNNVKPFYPQTKIHLLLVGNEVLHWGDQNMVSNLVPAMKSLNNALRRSGLGDIKVSTPHSLGILLSSDPPSSAMFRPGWDRNVLAPMLEFHRQTHSPFMVNPYPYFSWSPQNNDFSLFHRNPGKLDPVTGKKYFNVYDLLLDAVHMSMKKMGFADVEIAVGEVGWPSKGDPGMFHCTVENARWHNLNILYKAKSGVGTPLMPGRKFETYIFALFNENLKPGSEAERNFGLFRPDFSSVYDIGILRDGKAGGSAGGAQPNATAGGGSGSGSGAPAPEGGSGKQWCVAKADASDAALQNNIDWLCSTNQVDCSAVQGSGRCFLPNSVRSHAAYLMNAYYQAKGRQDFNCHFDGTGVVTTKDPSYGECLYEV